MSEPRPTTKSNSDSAAAHADRVPAKSSKSVEPTTGRVGLITYYRQCRSELSKVVWPTRSQLSTYFAVVVAFVMFVVTYVALLDLGFGSLVLKLLG